MFTTTQKIILASASPRRQQFLINLGIKHIVLTADIDESPLPGEQPDTFALRMARTKAAAVAEKNPTSWVIGADTAVALQDGTILGKPANTDEAVAMLRRLSDTTHQVLTGICLCCREQKKEFSHVETTEVTFVELTDDLIHAYVQTREPMDKAGSYGIQGIGSFLVRSIEGSCTNVIGLPVHSLVSLLTENNIISPSPTP